MRLLVFLTYPPISAADTADTFLKVPCNSLINQLSASPPPLIGGCGGIASPLLVVGAQRGLPWQADPSVPLGAPSQKW
jgi:hypothetical protein